MSSKLKPIVKSPHGEDLIRIVPKIPLCKGCYFDTIINKYEKESKVLITVDNYTFFFIEGGCTTLLYEKTDSRYKGQWPCIKKVFGKTIHYIYIEA